MADNPYVMGSGIRDQSWLVTDRFGRVYRLTLPRRKGPTQLMSRATGPAGTLELLTEEAFAPWGRGDRYAVADLVEICCELTGREVWRRYLRCHRGERGWRQRLDLVCEVLVRAFEQGCLLCERADRHVAASMEEAPDPHGQPPPPVPETKTWFELTVVDEAGMPIPEIEIAFAIGGEHASATTNAAGVARIDGVTSSFGSARVVNAAKLKEVLEPRWLTFRSVRLPTGEHVSARGLRSSLAAVSLVSETRHTLSIVPHHRRVRLVGMHFDTNKSFLLPSSMLGIRRIKELYDESDKTEVLVVGHTDATGDARYNEKLSLERAEAIVAFMMDDVEAWTGWFSASEPEKKWGDREINLMLSVLPEGERPFGEANANAARDPETTKRFQQWSNDTRGTSLLIDGKLGPDTRRALVAAYMALDHTSLPKGAKIVAHGCGPHQPLPADENGKPPRDADLRRVDIFAFDGRIRPPPPGKTSGKAAPEYPQWVAQMASTIDVHAENRTTLRIWLKDRDRQRMPNAPYRITFAGEIRTGAANADGLLEEDYVSMDVECILEWGEYASDDPHRGLEEYRYERQLFTNTHVQDSAQIDRKLHNLLYRDAPREESLAAFEDDYELPAADVSVVHAEGRPAPKKAQE